MDRIRTILDSPSPLPSLTPFILDISQDAALYNVNILKNFNYDLIRVIGVHPNSHISYCSEFWHIPVLEPLLHLSPFGNDIKSSLSNGSTYPLDIISNSRRHTDVEEAISRGNHKSSQSKIRILTKLLIKNLSLRFHLPITINAIMKILHAYVAPYVLIS